MGNQTQSERITESLNHTLFLLEQMLVQHREAEAYEVARERVQFLHEQFRLLYTELETFKAVCIVLGVTGADPAARKYWRDTCEYLYRQEPTSLASPSRAILAGDLELLSFIMYTGASVALVRERCARLIAYLSAYLQTAIQPNSMPAVTDRHTTELSDQQLSDAIEYLIARNVVQEPELLYRLTNRSLMNLPTHG